MWKWDQGRLDYFQFDNLKKIARFALKNDLYNATRDEFEDATGLPFSAGAGEDYQRPWRNYGRVFQLSMICVQRGKHSEATPVAALLANDGIISSDEYFHFLAQASTDPSPALSGWDATAELRYPLLFTLKYLLARVAKVADTTDVAEIVGAYQASGFVGDEDQNAFLALAKTTHTPVGDIRQARESIRRVLGQISYLSLKGQSLTVSLSGDDAMELFGQIKPLGGVPEQDRADEVLRRTEYFEPTLDELELDYVATAISDVEESGFSSSTTFAEGKKSRKTHLVIERNSKIRTEFFKANPSPVCDFCSTDTAKIYPWVERILDVHHLLPLCSGSRTSKNGTMLDDLVAVCPTCHRSVHRYYDQWLKASGKKDFLDAEEARSVYDAAKKEYEAVT
jgi:hypothetical protein